MSTLDVTCGRCDKTFRVRAEFAGRATRCPSCSAPLAIGTSAPVPRPRPEEPAPRPRATPKDDDDRPRKPTGNWRPVETALGREQSALVCLLLQVGGVLLAFCLGQVLESMGPIGWAAAIPFAILLGGPALAALVFGISARVAATGAPEESLARGTARASLIASFLGLGCLAGLALAALLAIEANARDELPMVVALGGLIVTGLASLGTFAGFVAQVGIARQSKGVSRGFGRLAVAATICTAGLLGIGGMYALVNAASGPSYYRGYYSRPDHEVFYSITMLGLIPICLIVMLILYHRLLAAARRSIRVDEA